jgi:hypothetical protein
MTVRAKATGSFRAIIDVVLFWDVNGDGQVMRFEVLFCDGCSCWGRVGSPHVCGKNWSKQVLPLLREIASEGA